MPPPAMTTRSSGPSRFAIRVGAYVRHTPAVAMVGRRTDGQSARGAGVYSKLRAGVLVLARLLRRRSWPQRVWSLIRSTLGVQ